VPSRAEPGTNGGGDADVRPARGEGIAAKLELHGALLDELRIPLEMLRTAVPAPTNLAYTSYLLATVRGGSYAEGVGVVLPCYWIYAAVGKELRIPRIRVTGDGLPPTAPTSTAMR